MKTFIWSTREYEILAANANTVEEAREMLIPVLNDFLDSELEYEKKRAEFYLENYKDISDKQYKSKQWWDREIENLKLRIRKEKEIIIKEPDIIIEENSALIFDHINE